MAQNWTLIKIQFRIYLDLDSSIFALDNLLGTKKYIYIYLEKTHGTQLDYNWNSNLTFSELYLLIIYIYIYMDR